MAKKIYIVFVLAFVAFGAYVFFSFRNTTIGPIQSHRSYDLEIISGDTGVQSNTRTTFVYRIKNEREEILKDFETVHEKIMHLIVVRKDLQEFQHLHPTFNQNTKYFSIDIVFLSDGLYRIFSDFTPAQNADNPLLLPVTLSHDIAVGDISNYKAPPAVVDTVLSKPIGDYEITFIPPPEWRIGVPISYTFKVKKNSKNVTNLELYLGALGHSVIVRADTLDYIHTHAEGGMNMSSADHDAIGTGVMEHSGPNIVFSTEFSESGFYKIFVQFQHEGKVFTTDFVVDVKDGPIAQSPASRLSLVGVLRL